MKLILNDCESALAEMGENFVDAVVTDPPYGMKFMNKHWDYELPSVAKWQSIFRVLKPGGYALIACGTRTQHRMIVNVEDAGFEIRDVITYLYGSGFPKSLDISKAIDKAAGIPIPKGDGRFITLDTGGKSNGGSAMRSDSPEYKSRAVVTEAAKLWQGFGTALKPACEFWTLARKPLSEKTVAANVLKWGVGGINIDGCRINGGGPKGEGGRLAGSTGSVSQFNSGNHNPINDSQGRFPANLLLDEQAAFMLDEQSGISKSNYRKNSATTRNTEETQSGWKLWDRSTNLHDDSGGASRFFYCAKASKSERNAGLEGMPLIKEGIGDERPSGQSMQRLDGRPAREVANFHPTVKPIKLMEYLCKLVTPPGGIILDPFLGSGSTGVAAKNLGFKIIGIECEKEYFEIAKKRIVYAMKLKKGRK